MRVVVVVVAQLYDILPFRIECDGTRIQWDMTR